jgi:hypothetical protein
LTPREGEYAVKLLYSRNGQPSLVTLGDGSTLRVINTTWGRDFDAEYDHVSANVSPFVDGWPIATFDASEICQIVDEQGAILFRVSDQT